MNISINFRNATKERPPESMDVVVVCGSSYIGNVGYSKKNDQFNSYDHQPPKEVDDFADAMCWVPFEEVMKAIKEATHE